MADSGPDTGHSPSAGADSPAKPGRIEFLDQYRGFTVFLMIAVNLLAEFSIVPPWLKHATEYGSVTITDFVITMFVFIMGVAFELTLPRSIAAKGRGRTVWRFVRRSLLLIGFGVLGSVLLKRDLIGEWGVLQTLGCAGLVALPFMFTDTGRRTFIAVLLIAIYELIGAAGHWAWLKAHDTGHLGGIPAGLAWGGVVLLGSLCGGYIRRHDEQVFRRACVAIGVAGIGLTLVLRGRLPVSKPLVTATYVTAATGCAASVLLLFELLRPRFAPFRWLGMNALAIFMLHGLLLETVLRAVRPAGSLPVVLLAGAGLLGVCLLVAGIFYWRRIFIRL